MIAIVAVILSGFLFGYEFMGRALGALISYAVAYKILEHFDVAETVRFGIRFLSKSQFYWLTTLILFAVFIPLIRRPHLLPPAYFMLICLTINTYFEDVNQAIINHLRRLWS